MSISLPGLSANFTLGALAVVALLHGVELGGEEPADFSPAVQPYPLVVALPEAKNTPMPADCAWAKPSYPVLILFDGQSNGDAGCAEQDESQLPVGAARLAALEQKEEATVAQPVAKVADMAAHIGSPAMANAAERSTPAMPAALDRSDLANVLNINFNLAGATAGPSGLAIRKRVFADGVALGEVELRVVADAQILVRSADLSSKLSDHGLSEHPAVLKTLASREFVDFDAVRRAGLSIRYDAARDALLIDTARRL